MWVVFIPLAVLALVALLAVGFFFSRRGVARGPHPDDVRGIPE
jgi:hypothetical protein